VGTKFNPFTSNFDIVLDKASEIINVPSGNLAATTVQAALNELQGDINTINTDIADDVEGPASSTDNAIARFDGSTGKLLQNSAVTIDDSGNVTISPSGSGTALDITHSSNGNSININQTGSGNAIQVVSGSVQLDPLTASRAIVTDANKRLISSTTTATEIGYVNGVTSAIQTQLDAKQATITGAATTIVSSNLTASRAVVSDGSGKVAVATTTATEIGYVNGVTSAIQTQIDSKQATITGGATTIVSSNLTVSRALVSDGSGKVAVATTTSTELGYVNGVTSAIQTQLDAKQAKLRTIVSVSTNVTLTTNAIHFVNTSSARSLTLPSPVSGTEITIKDVTGSANVNNITVVRFGSETIEGVAASYAMDQTYQSITLVADGTNWWIV
jgi:hypothetical protein